MTSKTTVLAVVIFLGLVTLVVTVGGIILAADGKTIPAELVALGSAALGALAGLLASPRSTLGKGDIEPTVVTGMVPVRPPSEPVPVEVHQPSDEPVPARVVDGDPFTAAAAAMTAPVDPMAVARRAG